MMFSVGLFAVAVVAQLEAAQHSALMTLFQDLNCPPSLCPRFSAAAPCPETTVLTCDGNSLTRLSLRDVQLNGTLTATIGALTALRTLSIFDNPALKGQLHTTLGRLTFLQFL